MVEGSSQHHVCNVCGEWFEEALALLAHAELHARYCLETVYINVVVSDICVQYSDVLKALVK